MVSKADEEISISTAVVFIKKLVQYLLRKWAIIVVIAVLGALTGFFYAINKKPTYTTLLTFVLSSEPKTGGLTSLASQLGFGSATSGGSDLFAGDNILTFVSISYNGRENSLKYHLVKIKLS